MTGKSEAPPPDSVATINALLGARRERRAAEARELWLAAHYVDQCGVLEHDGAPVVPGTEQLVPVGAEGSGLVAEFAVLELAVALETTEAKAAALMADACDLRARMPQVWGLVQDCQVEVWLARKVAFLTRRVPLKAMKQIDEQVSARITSMPVARLIRLVEGLVAQGLTPERLTDERDLALSGRGVWFEQQDHVHAISGVLDAADGVLLDGQLDRLARILADGGSQESEQVRRAEALGLLANPALALQMLQASLLDELPADPTSTEGGCPAAGQPGHTCGAVTVDPAKLAPQAHLVVHVTDEQLRTGDGVARSNQLGPQLIGWVKETLAGCRITVRPTIDLDGMAPADAYEVPARMREAVALRNPTSVFPHSSRPSHGLDLDHTVPFDRAGPPGQTRPGNLGPLSRRQHRAKTHAGWQATQPHPGVFLWKSPHGIIAVTTPSGTWTLHVPTSQEESAAA